MCWRLGSHPLHSWEVEGYEDIEPNGRKLGHYRYVCVLNVLLGTQTSFPGPLPCAPIMMDNVSTGLKPQNTTVGN